MTVSPAPGSLLGRFLVEQELRRDRFGVLVAARDLARDAPVIVRLLNLDRLQDVDERARLQQRLEAATTLEHPGIVRVLELGREGAARFVVHPPLDGRLLSEQLAAGPLPPSDVGELARQLGAALDHAHAVGQVHGSVSPNSIVLDASGRALLTDFGLASPERQERIDYLDDEPESARYLSTEQAAGQAIDARSDLYSLAVVLFEALSGRPPFSHPSHLVVLVQHMTAEPPSVRAFAPQLPVELDAVFRRALAKRAGDRFESGAVLAELLRTALRTVPAEDSPGARGRLPSTATTSGGLPLPRGRRRAIVGALLAVTVVLAGGLVIGSRETGGAAAPPSAARAEAPPTVPVLPTPLPAAPFAAPATAAAPSAGVSYVEPSPVAAPPVAVSPVPTIATPDPALEIAAELRAASGAWQRGDWARVIAMLGPLASRYPEHPVLRDKLYAAHYERGRSLEIAEKPVEAHAAYAAAQRVDPARLEARARLEVTAEVGRPIAWRVYRWAPGPAYEGAGLRASPDDRDSDRFESAYLLESTQARSAQAVWEPTAAPVGGAFVAQVSFLLADQPGGLDFALWERAAGQPRYTLRVFRTETGVAWGALQAWKDGANEVLAVAGPRAPRLRVAISSAVEGPNVARLDVRDGRLTATLNGTQLWTGPLSHAVDHVTLGVYTQETATTRLGVLEYHVFEPR